MGSCPLPCPPSPSVTLPFSDGIQYVCCAVAGQVAGGPTNQEILDQLALLSTKLDKVSKDMEVLNTKSDKVSNDMEVLSMKVDKVIKDMEADGSQLLQVQRAGD